MLNLSNLPDELIRMIFYYLQAPEAKIIQDELNVYNTGHICMTRKTVYYLVSSTRSFSKYYFDKLTNPYEFESSYYDHFASNSELVIRHTKGYPIKHYRH